MPLSLCIFIYLYQILSYDLNWSRITILTCLIEILFMRFIMSDVSEALDDVFGLERISYARFYNTSNIRRPAQAGLKMDVWDTMQLPTGSILHTLNGLETLETSTGGLPNPTLPLVVNEKLPIYLKINTTVASADTVPFGVSETYTYRPNILSAQISHFYQTHRKFHRVLSDRTLGSMSGVLTWLDYSPLNELKVSGTLHAYRKFDIVFRTILDKIASIGPNGHHYIVLPQSHHVFARTILQRSFKELSTGTLNAFAHDPSIFPILHLLGYVYGKTHDLSVAPYKEDIKILGKGNDLFETLKSTSLLERLNPNLHSSINFILQKDNKAIVYNLEDLTRFSEDVSFFTKFYRHIMNLRLSDSVLPEHTDVEDDQYDTYIENVSQQQVSSKENEAIVTPEISKADEPGIPIKVLEEATQRAKPVSLEKPAIEPNPDTSFESRLRTAVVHHTAAIISNEPKKENRRNTLLENHLKVTIAGKPLGELIQPLVTQKITPKDMPFITAAPEQSYQKSSLLSMDRAYQTHVYHHELAKVVGSLAKHGMFINKVDEDKTHTEMDRLTTYRLNLSDLDGKTHHVKFTVPDVDANGKMKISGVDYQLTRQIANIPICKISPSRVNLSSYYNKIIVERVQSKRYSYEQDTYKLIMSLRAKGLLTAVLGSAPAPTESVAYDYSAIGKNFVEVKVNDYTFHFHGNHAPLELLAGRTLKDIQTLQSTYGAFVGTGPNDSVLFWNKDNQIHLYKDDNVEQSWKSFHRFLFDMFGEQGIPERTPLEWTQANIINQTIPLVYILATRFGLKPVLEMINLDYNFYPKGMSYNLNIDDIDVKLADGTIVFNRYPLTRSMIAAGLTWTSLKDFRFNDLNIPDTYTKVFQQKGMSIGVLKGLSGFFDFFVDPITESVLEKMNEPITFHGLLLRANVLLIDYHAEESSSVKLHRFRLYERFNGIVYNEIYRSLANHRNNPSSKKSFSINPEAVFQKIVQDATISQEEVINPVHEVKQRANFTFTGSGGRTANGFVLRDRIYPKDGLGIISDAVPDSGKVGITAYLSASPNIDDVHGIPKAYKEGDVLEPPQILSIGSMVMPGGTTDDGKRNSYLSIQISHYVPNHDDGETLAVRTGYDAVLPHLSSDVFAISAEDDGVVESVDDKQGVLKVRYKDTPTQSLRSLKLPYLDTVLDAYRRDNTSFGFLIPDTEISKYPMGGVFSFTKNTYGKIVDRLRCDNANSIPDKDIARKQNSLIHDLDKGKYEALYYIRFSPMGNMIPGSIKGYAFSSLYSQNSGSYLLQKRILNVKAGDTFKTGDILIYNPGFFVPDPMSKQVTFKHGVTATVALVEKSSNHEDACEISRDLSDRLKMTPCHQREIVTKSSAVILGMVKLGDHVETSDTLCVISDDYVIGTSLNVTSENLDIFEKLNRQTPAADYTGTVVKIRILYGCERDQLSESLKTVLKAYEKEVRDTFKALNTNSDLKPPERPGWVAPKTRYQGIEFTNDTVILEFMIQETLTVSEGDKIILSNAAKSVVSHVSEKQHYTESGIRVDVLFSTTSIVNRIIKSPFNGIAERNMQALKEQVLDLYFDK